MRKVIYVLIFLSISGISIAQTVSREVFNAPPQLSYSGSAFEVDYEKYLSNHDVVYLSPPKEGYEAFPLGNGNVGAMIYCTSNGFSIQVNKNDIWDQSGAEEMLLRSCGQINIDFGAPVFEWLYQNKFEARLSLYEAQASFNGITPFADISANAKAHARKNLFIFRNQFNTKGPLAGDGSKVSVSLDRWGSRAFGGWYNSISRPAEAGIGNAVAGKLNDDIYIQESFSNMSFVIAVRIVGCKKQAEMVNKRTAKFMLNAVSFQDFSILVSVATSNESDHPLEHAIAILDEAEKEGLENLNTSHNKWWREFWQKSFVHIGDNYIENLYYNHFYLMGSASRGKYPAIFNASLWTWNRDVRQWISPHHWNTQQSYWSLNAANHSELMKPYLDTYWRLLPSAEAFAQQRGFKNAILWSEKHDFSGKMLTWNAPSFINNFTPASQIAQLFWQQYQFTLNKEFLRDTAYVFMKKAAEFYLQYLSWDSLNKRYYIYPASPYESESANTMTNTLTDLSTIRVSFQACIQASEILKTDRDKRKKWQSVLDNLASYPLSHIKNAGEVLAVAQTERDTIDNNPQDYTFCKATAAVFPSGDIGLGQKGSRYFNAAINRSRLHPPNTLAISPAAVISARLGLANEALQQLSMSIRQLQHFPQGLFYNLDHWSYLSRYGDKYPNSFVETQRDYILDRGTQYKNIKAFERGKDVSVVNTPTLPFIQSGMEPSAILATAVNEMLLQSHAGVIRVFPATPVEWPAAFTLLARGGFLVSSEKQQNDSVPFYITIKSLAAQTCRIANSWSSLPQVTELIDGKQVPVKYSVQPEQVISFPTKENGIYLVQRSSNSFSVPVIKKYVAEKNEAPKTYKEAILGKPRDF